MLMDLGDEADVARGSGVRMQALMGSGACREREYAKPYGEHEAAPCGRKNSTSSG
jgi:hypothetical protein